MHLLSDSNACCSDGPNACLSSFGVPSHGEHLLLNLAWQGQRAFENLRGAEPVIEREIHT
jgi:hypothetical protein